jgi:putative chitinase
MARYQINTTKRVAGFLAQIAVESNELRHLSEYWTSQKNFKLPGVRRPAHTATSKVDYFEHWYGKRADLGNVTARDGYTYRGRGAIQITGKSMYRTVGNAIGKPLEKSPDLLLTDPEVDMLASAYLFAGSKHLNQVADSVDPDDPKSVQNINERLTLAVNGGYNDLSERLRYYKQAFKVLPLGIGQDIPFRTTGELGTRYA